MKKGQEGLAEVVQFSSDRDVRQPPTQCNSASVPFSALSSESCRGYGKLNTTPMLVHAAGIVKCASL